MNDWLYERSIDEHDQRSLQLVMIVFKIQHNDSIYILLKFNKREDAAVYYFILDRNYFSSWLVIIDLTITQPNHSGWGWGMQLLVL